MPIPGRATPDATAGYAARFAGRLPPSAFAPLGVTGLTVSRVGFGAYRVDDRTKEHRAALARALEAGANLVDTSTSYTGGASERLVGAVVGDLARSGRVPRAAVVVVSTIGHAQGQPLHPDLLEEQLARSLARLDLETLDVCLLHNPEQLLSGAARRGLAAGPAALAARRDELYRRLYEAFRYLEGQVAAGRVGAYGVSSSTVARPQDDPEATSLPRMLDAAHEAGGAAHHFRVLQLPMNLLETDALRLLDLAQRARLGVLVSRPLDAVDGARVLRLADVEVPAPIVGLDVQRIVLAVLEAEFQRDLAVEIEVGPGSVAPSEFFRWSQELSDMAERVKGLEQWRQVETQMVIPAMNQCIRVLDGALAGDLGDRWRTWRSRYVPELVRFLEAMRREAALESRAAVARVRDRVDRHLPPARRGESLSRKAVWVLASTPGVTTVLTGMRTPEYVEDTLGVLGWPPLADPGAVYEGLRQVHGQR